eukprot:SAG31_NODE_1260_length_9073_cov_2.761088_4_plen_84_part_00
MYSVDTVLSIIRARTVILNTKFLTVSTGSYEPGSCRSMTAVCRQLYIATRGVLSLASRRYELALLIFKNLSNKYELEYLEGTY